MRQVALMLAASIASFSAACAPVPAWKRGVLAHECMRPDARPEESRAQAHMLGAQEGAPGAIGDRGGGCGCK